MNKKTMAQLIQFIAIIVVIALVVLLPACEEKETKSKAISTKKTEKEIVKIGFLAPLTGGLAAIAEPSRDAALLALEEINTNKLVAGKKLEFVFEDDACDQKTSLSAVQKMITQDKVRAIIGPICSPSVLADASVVEENKILFMTSIATNPAITNAGDYVFRNVPSDANQGVEGARLVQKLGAKKTGIIYINNDWGKGMKNVFAAEAKRIGLSIASIETYDKSATDFRTQLTKLKATQPDVVYMLAFPAESGLILKQARELGMTMQFVGADGSKDDSVIATAGKAAEGLIVTLPGVPDSPELKAFADKFKAKYGKEYSAYGPETYDLVYLIAKACVATDCTSPAMKNYLYEMGEYAGASGRYAFDSNGEVQKSYDLFEVRNGIWTQYKR